MHGTLIICMHISQTTINKEHVKPPRKSHASMKITAVEVKTGDPVRSRK